MKLLLALALIVVAAVTFAGICGDDSRLTDEEFLDEARRIAEEAPLITDSDVPPGWSRAPDEIPEDEESVKGDFTDEQPDVFSGECREWFEASQGPVTNYFPGDLSGVVVDTYADPDGNKIMAAASIFREGSDLDNALDQQDAFTADCGSDLIDAIGKTIPNGQALADVGFSMAFEPSFDLGDRSSGWNIVITYSVVGTDYEVTYNVTFIKVGRVVLSLAMDNLRDFSGESQEEVANAAVARAREIDQALPD